MLDIADYVPIPLMIGIMVLGILVTLLACLPTAWVDKATREVEKRQRRSPS